MSHTTVALPFPDVIQAHHPSLVVLDVALQAAISALYHAHPTLELEDEPPPYDHSATADEILAQIIVLSSIALIDLLRHYRAVQAENAF